MNNMQYKKIFHLYYIYIYIYSVFIYRDVYAVLYVYLFMNMCRTGVQRA